MTSEKAWAGGAPRTRAVHAGSVPDPATGSMTTPIHRTTGFAFDSVEEMAETFAGRRAHYIYTRYDNPTLKEAEAKLAALEDAPPGAEAVVFSSGMAAISAGLLAGLSAGDHLVAQAELYGGTTMLLRSFAGRFGIGVDFIAGAELEAGNLDAVLDRAARETTRAIYLETPANPTLQIVDIRAVAHAARGRGWRLYVDNTFASPINQRPFELGADVILHSATKYLAGHDDLTAGFLLAAGEILVNARQIRIDMGACLDPSVGWLLARSMKTLGLRVAAQNDNALAVARHLEAHPKVGRVNYPGLPSHAGHAVAARQMHGYGGMLSFDLAVEQHHAAEAAARALKSFRMIRIVPTLGGVETLAMVPAVSSHFRIPAEERRKAGIGDGLIRLSVGIEDAQDIIQDLDRALERV